MIATNPFPFVVDSTSIDLPAYFEDNVDMKIEYKKRLISLTNIKVSVNLSLSKADYLIFTNYLIGDIHSSQYFFNMDLEIFGKYEIFTVDITSNPKVVFKNNYYSVNFNVVIV